MKEKLKGQKRTTATLIALGIVIGLMLSGTALAASYLTKTQGNKLYLNNTKTYVQGNFTVSASSSTTGQVSCPTGWQALGGGVQPNSITANTLAVRWSAPIVDGDNLVAAGDGQNPRSTGWAARILNTDGVSSYTFSVGVICSK